MTRKKRDYTRIVVPDPKFKDVVISKTVNVIMESGKKGVAERSIYDALDIIQERTKKDPLEVFHTAIENVKPTVEVRSRRVGGANYQVPTEVRPARSLALAIRWIKTAASQRTEKKLSLRLAAELLEASDNRGFAVKKREDTHKMAEANKAFAHFKW